MSPLINTTSATALLGLDGVRSLGLTAVIVAPSWSSAAPSFQSSALTLTSTAPFLAPFTGVRRDVPELAATGMRGVDGTPRTGPGVLLELHPQAVNRLETLVNNRLGAAGPIRPVPAIVAVSGASGTPRAPEPLAAGDELASGGTPTITFHDRLGRIVCPVAAAALLKDLATNLPALCPDGPPATTGGGLGAVAQLASGVAVHVVDPHGMPFAAPTAEAIVVNPGGQAPGANGLVTLAANQTIAGSLATAVRLRWGWARNARLGVAALNPPGLGGVALNRQFLRVCAVDLMWHLLGNRTAATVQGIGPDDQTIPAALQPPVRDNVNIDFLADGVDVLHAAGAAVAAFGGGAGELRWVVSPTIRTQVGVPPPPFPAAPPSPNPATHWPAFPAPPAGAGGTVTGTPAFTAAWGTDNDVVLTLTAGTVARGSHVRVYPRRFQVIRSIAAEPSFLRGDGGAAVVANEAQALPMALENPLALEDGAPRPAAAALVLDVVVTSRALVVQTFASVVVGIADDPAPAVADQFAAPDPMAAVGATVQGLGPSPVFGIPGGPFAPAAPTTVVGLLRAFASETSPRIAPRAPTMARFPTLVASRAGAQRAWAAVVSGGRWTRQTRSASQDLGNPGNPPGADVHAAGARVDAALAFDVATCAIRRVAPVVPLTASGLSWIPWVDLTLWNATTLAAAPAPATCAGAVLRTVGAGCETPELESLPVSAIVDSAQAATNAVVAAVGGFPVVANAAAVVTELRREVYISQNGQRDALWALRRAVGQATSLVFVASPQFCATARPGDTPAAHEIDLVDVLAERLAAQPALRVIVATPRLPDLDPGYGGWVREALAARADAHAALTGAAADRVVFFHPAGFPGRDAAIRTTCVVVDDMFALAGTSHWRRRGMTFDEGVDVVGIDRALDNAGASTRVRQFRRAFMAALLRVAVGAAPNPPTSDWVRLSEPAGAFDLVATLVAQGGLGRVLPFWPGPADEDVPAQTHDVADPDGAASDRYLELFAGLVGETADD